MALDWLRNAHCRSYAESAQSELWLSGCVVDKAREGYALANASFMFLFLTFTISLVKKIPGGPRMQVFVVTVGSLALCAVPVYWKNEKQGHDLFSQEKPEAVKASEEKLQREHYRKQKNQQQQS